MKILKETLFERIRNRMAPANAVKVITALQRATHREEIDFMATKEASEMVERYGLETRMAIRDFRRWQTRQVTREMRQPIFEQEGRFLKAAARAKASLYLDAKRDYLDLVDLSMSMYGDNPANDQ